MLKKISFILCLLLLFSCKRQVYLPKTDDSSLASLRFSNGLRQVEEFGPNRLEYTLEVPSTIESFLTICTPNNPRATCTFEALGQPLSIPLIPVGGGLLNNFDVNIFVRAPDGSETGYIVHVYIK